MLGWFISNAIALRMRGMEFPDQGGPDASANTWEVLETFLDGADGGARFEQRAAMATREAAVPWYRRPFFWEGYGLGLAARHAMLFAKGTPSPRFEAPGFRFMFFTGVGFYQGVAMSNPLPKLDLSPEAWSDVEDFAIGRPLIAGGVSFARVAAGKRWSHEVVKPLLVDQDPEWTRGVWLGCGRALWFLYMRRFEFINEVLDGLDHADARMLAAGLGVAITYTQLSESGRIESDVLQLSPRYQEDARSGVRLCLAAACEDDPRIIDIIRDFDDPLPRYYSDGAEILTGLDRGADAAAQLFEAFAAWAEPQAEASSP